MTLALIVVLFTVICRIAADEGAQLDDISTSTCSQVETEPTSPYWVLYGGIFFVCLVVVALFWAMAFVCEEYFVPALNILCEEYKIPDDVAGATFMAAGASSPELFTSFIGLVFFQSNIGVGTVVGSEIFNHMIISAGSVAFAKGGVLTLDKYIISRDVIAYMLSLLFLIYALKGDVVGPLLNTFNFSTWKDCLNVTIYSSLLLVALYVVYAVILAYFQQLLPYFVPETVPEEVAAEKVEDNVGVSRSTHSGSTAVAMVVDWIEAVVKTTKQLFQQFQQQREQQKQKQRKKQRGKSKKNKTKLKMKVVSDKQYHALNSSVSGNGAAAGDGSNIDSHRGEGGEEASDDDDDDEEEGEEEEELYEGEEEERGEVVELGLQRTKLKASLLSPSQQRQQQAEDDMLNEANSRHGTYSPLLLPAGSTSTITSTSTSTKPTQSSPPPSSTVHSATVTAAAGAGAGNTTTTTTTTVDSPSRGRGLRSYSVDSTGASSSQQQQRGGGGGGGKKRAPAAGGLVRHQITHMTVKPLDLENVPGVGGTQEKILGKQPAMRRTSLLRGALQEVRAVAKAQSTRDLQRMLHLAASRDEEEEEEEEEGGGGGGGGEEEEDGGRGRGGGGGRDLESGNTIGGIKLSSSRSISGSRSNKIRNKGGLDVVPSIAEQQEDGEEEGNDEESRRGVVVPAAGAQSMNSFADLDDSISTSSRTPAAADDMDGPSVMFSNIYKSTSNVSAINQEDVTPAATAAEDTSYDARAGVEAEVNADADAEAGGDNLRSGFRKSQSAFVDYDAVYEDGLEAGDSLSYDRDSLTDRPIEAAAAAVQPPSMPKTTKVMTSGVREIAANQEVPMVNVAAASSTASMTSFSGRPPFPFPTPAASSTASSMANILPMSPSQLDLALEPQKYLAMTQSLSSLPASASASGSAGGAMRVGGMLGDGRGMLEESLNYTPDQRHAAAIMGMKFELFSNVARLMVTKDTSIHPALVPTPLTKFLNYVLDTKPPETLTTLHYSRQRMQCYLYIYRDVLKLDALPPLRVWQLRYFTVDEYGLSFCSYEDLPSTGSHMKLVPLEHCSGVGIVDKDALTFALNFAAATTVDGSGSEEEGGESGENEAHQLQLRAPSQEILEMVIERLHLLLASRKAKLHLRLQLWEEVLMEDQEELSTHHESMLIAPRGRYPYLWHLIVYPLKWCFYHTLKDCREARYRDKYGQVILTSVVYLAVLSFAMINCCDIIGVYTGTTPTIMGLTLSAVGTSFPNLWSSMVVARQGFGNMAICNAFGSNIFNINVALGFPWVFYVAFILNCAPYNQMQDNGIVFFVILLEVISVIWMSLIWAFDFKMYAWMAPIFIVLYLLVMWLAIALA